MLLICVSFMVLPFNDSDILVESEDGACQQERLRHVVEQSGGHVADFDHLIRHQRDAAHDEQHRTSVLRDFESCVFHSLHHCGTTSSAEEKTDEVTECLEHHFPCFVHNRCVFKVLINRVNSMCFKVLYYPSTTLQRYEIFPRYANISGRKCRGGQRNTVENAACRSS